MPTSPRWRPRSTTRRSIPTTRSTSISRSARRMRIAAPTKPRGAIMPPAIAQRSAELGHDPARVTALVDRSIALFDAPFFAARAGQGHPAPDPIFILGMPRAGSTLVEQILASHPLVEGTMELPDLTVDRPRARRRRAGPTPSPRHASIPTQLADARPRLCRADPRPPPDRQAVFHRQDAQQLGLCRLHPPDPAQCEDHRRPPPPARLRLFQLQAALSRAARRSATTSATSANIMPTMCG